MRLENKKMLAARTLGIGRNRILFNEQRLSEVKEAITKQDIKDLKESGAIIIKEKKGRKARTRRRTRRRGGKIKKKIISRKREYITLTRKLRGYISDLKRKELISREEFEKLRKEIKTSSFKSLAHIKEKISGAK